MKEPPVIKVQFIHIQGPLKGQIQEFSEPSIVIGRHPSCQVQFPTDQTGISRKHAEVMREGNRFKLTDHSTNGTFVNGKRITETYLKDGDVIMFTEGGPKVSFLTQITEAPMAEKITAAPVMPPAIETPPVAASAPVIPAAAPVAAATPAPTPPPQCVAKVAAPLIIQFGPALRSYKELPVVIGQQGDCDFVLAHPAIAARQAQIFFSRNEYWVRDLTGRSSIVINGAPIGLEACLKTNDIITLAAGGPALRYLGEGRLAEQEEVPAEAAPAPAKPETPPKKAKSSIFDVFKK